jgi:hypothetical protein
MEQSAQDILQDLLHPDALPDLVSHLLAGAGERSKFIAALPVLKPRKLEPGVTPSVYPYSPLPNKSSIRILKILPVLPKRSASLFSVDEELRYPVKCCMKVVDLDENPDYEALSYTWGDPLVLYRYQEDIFSQEEWYKPGYEVTIDGHTVSVTANLFAAMLSRRFAAEMVHLSDRSGVAAGMEMLNYQPSSYIWIDAICINQADLQERAAQIPLICRIYSVARTVIAWLGGDDEASLDAFNIMNTLAEIYPRQTELTQTLKTMSMFNPEVYRIMNTRPINFLQWSNLFSFLNRSWFKRAWVVQEMGVAKNPIISIGVKIFNLESLIGTILFLSETRWAGELGGLGAASVEKEDHEDEIAVARNRDHGLPEGFRNPFALYSSQPMKVWDPRIFEITQNVRAGFGIKCSGYQSRPGAGPFSLRRLLSIFRPTEASDLRDKVYAFVGISKESSSGLLSSQNALVPNYQSPCREVYVDTAKFIINSSGNLDVLSQVQDASFRKQQDLPSWVPDFSADGYPTPIENAFPLPWNASHGFGSMHVLFHSDDSLEVRGLCLGKVRTATRIDPKSKNMFKDIFMWLLLLPTVSEIPSPPTTQRLKHFIETAHDKYVSDRQPRLQRVAALPPEGSRVKILRQSRMEVFWRTLLMDSFRAQHPAPAICGKTVNFLRQHEISTAIMEIWKSVLEGDLSMLLERGDRVPEEFVFWKRLDSVTSQTFGTWLPCEREFKEFQLAWHLQQSGQYTVDQAAEATIKLRKALKASLDGMDAELEAEIKHRIRAGTYARELFLLNTGHLGQGFKSLRRDDELWILCGASMPFLLRPVSPGRYQLVGEAYVHGLMHGALPGSDRSTRLISIV